MPVRRLLLSFAALILLAVFLLFGRTPPAVHAQNTTQEIILVTNGAPSGFGSLHQAILNANANPDLSTILFNINNPAPQIFILGELPPITAPVVINGLSQSGATCSNPRLIIGGGATPGLTLAADDSTITGLTIQNRSAGGILILGGDDNTITCNSFNSNGFGVRVIQGDGNRIGLPGQGNRMIGNVGFGVDFLTGGPTSTVVENTMTANGGGIAMTATSGVTIDNNQINGNLGYGIRLEASGNIQIGSIFGNSISGNSISGVQVNASTGVTMRLNRIVGNLGNGVTAANSTVTIGGITGVAGNAIETNIGHGIHLSGAAGVGSQIQGNSLTGNLGHGVFLEGVSDTVVGGDTLRRNHIVLNTGTGVLISGVTANGNRVLGNTIDRNTMDGVHILNAPGNLVTDSNIITRNAASGVRLEGANATNNTVQGNVIGTSASGSLGQGNGQHGILIEEAPGNLIGGLGASQHNVISCNDRSGVVLTGFGTSDNVVQGNYIGSTPMGGAMPCLQRFGVLIDNGADSNLIGGADPDAGNFIISTSEAGVGILTEVTTNNSVFGNQIGMSPQGLLLGNNQYGVMIDYAYGNFIGGPGAGEGNVIAGSGEADVYITNTYDFVVPGNVVSGNTIGLYPGGLYAAGPATYGVFIFDASNNTIGGSGPGAGNTIFSNAYSVLIADPTSVQNTVQGNTIGLRADGSDVPIGGAVPDTGVWIYNANNNTVADNLIAGHQFNVRIQGDTDTPVGNFVSGNTIGLTGTGSGHLYGIQQIGVLVQHANGNLIGRGNVISAHRIANVSIMDTAQANAVLGNIIGAFDPAVAGPELPVAESGVFLASGVNYVGGLGPADGNVIVNYEYGVYITASASNVQVLNNLIGVDGENDTPLYNSYGVFVQGAASPIIGLNSAGNVISNSSIGIHMLPLGTVPVTDPVIEGNIIGLDADGASVIGNTFGMLLEGTQRARITANTVSGNGEGIAIRDGFGTLVPSADTRIFGNRVGTDITGALPAGNIAGISATTGDVQIGGMGTGQPNLIAFNLGSGVIVGPLNRTNIGVSILSNSIHDNGALGIDLGGDGVTLNDPGDIDPGPNALQNFPEITAAFTNGVIRAEMYGAGDTTFTVQVFYNSACDASGYGEGETLLGTFDATTGPDGYAAFVMETGASLAVGDILTLTATAPDGSTSEFSPCAEALPPNRPPEAGDIAVTTDEDVPMTIPVLDYTSDPDGDTLTVVGVSTPANGAAVVNPDGTVAYAPNANFFGIDTFTYTVTDGEFEATALVTVTVNPVNDPPIAVDDAATTPANVPVTIAVLANDAEIEGNPMIVSSVSAPANGSAGINPDGTVTYTPNLNFVGTDTFTYVVSDTYGGEDTATVTVTVTAPVCEGDAYNPDRDLSGLLLEETGFTTGRVTNNSPACSYVIGIASYLKFDEIVDNQTLFASNTMTIAPGQTVEISVSLPACATQVDLFWGDVLDSLAGQRYGGRLLDARHLPGEYCSPPGAPE